MKIHSAARYLPRYRITKETIENESGNFRPAGIDEIAVPSADEDSLTMAYEAGTKAIEAGTIDPTTIQSLYLATTTPPLEEEDIGVRLAEMLDLPSDIRIQTLTQSTNGIGEAIRTAITTKNTALIIGSDCPHGEFDTVLGQAGGAGAAAILLEEADISGFNDFSSYSAVFPGTRYRERGNTTTQQIGIAGYEREAYYQTISSAIKSLDSTITEIDAIAVQAPNGVLPYRIGTQLDIAHEKIANGTIVTETGDLGSASALTGLVTAFSKDITNTIVCTYGSGGTATAFHINQAGKIDTKITDKEHEEIGMLTQLRQRYRVVSPEPEGGGAYVSLPSWKRTLDQRYNLLGGKCQTCNELVFPPHGACPECGEQDEYEMKSLATEGEIIAITEIKQGGAPPEFQQFQSATGSYASAIVTVNGPDTETVDIPVMINFVDSAPSVGDHISLTIRRLYTQEGIPRYSMKGVC
ncbi:MAG: zinc ribbon domain-containing protein [Halobacteriaceae archaeon]